MAHAVADVVGGFIGGVVGAAVGFLVGGPVGAVAGAISGAAEGASLVDQVQTAQDKAAEVKQDTSTTSVTSSTGTGGGSSTNTRPGADGTPTALAPDDPNAKTPTQLDLANEVWAQYNLQMNQMREQIGTQVLGMKATEVSIESSMRASTALRGLKMGGSPLVQMYSQQKNAAQALKYAEDVGAASIAGDEQAQALAADKFRWSKAQQIQQADTAVSDAWVSAVTQGLNFAGTLMTARFPTSLFSFGGGGGGGQPSSYTYPGSTQQAVYG